ncbi:unnamed protein product [Spirodela intermedia]|uniref:Uncharacterized protein n=1 Tax=Spirodela intermedia TaxID=51605 RepID=A0A7I8IEL6_SPIIN|nr:unnamed protein product [Spirodela intermedia]CAA6656238.1 unnamed protein product [Spirodela intermedia]
MVVFLEESPRSLMVSKYWVTIIRSITSLALVPETVWEKLRMLSLKPSVIACRCLATPMPPRYLASASASALFTMRIFSASPLKMLACRSLWALSALMDLVQYRPLRSVRCYIHMLPSPGPQFCKV